MVSIKKFANGKSDKNIIEENQNYWMESAVELQEKIDEFHNTQRIDRYFISVIYVLQLINIGVIVGLLMVSI